MKYTYILVFMLFFLSACDRDSRVHTIPDDLKIVPGQKRTPKTEEVEEVPEDSSEMAEIQDSLDVDEMSDSTEVEQKDSVSDYEPAEVISKHLAAIGAGFRSKKKTVKITAVYNQGGQAMPIVSYTKRPSFNRVEMEIPSQGQKFYLTQGYDGKDAWKIQSWLGDKVEDATPEEKDRFKARCDVDGDLWKWKEKGNKITAEGYEDVNGNKHYKMKLRTDDDLQTIFIHTETFMISKVSQKTKINGQEYLAETEFEDYISVEGIKEPRKTTQKYDGNVSHVVEYKKIEYDLPMSDTLFTRPIENK